MAAIVIPVTLTKRFGKSTGWKLSAPFNFISLIIGFSLAATGLALLGQTISLFSKIGRGTLAPWEPPKKLVIQGVYRYVRNPMISGVFFVLLGEAFILRSIPILGWFLLFVSGNAIYIPCSEEPGLLKRFGNNYEIYRENVPRWIPRLTPWTPDH